MSLSARSNQYWNIILVILVINLSLSRLWRMTSWAYSCVTCTYLHAHSYTILSILIKLVNKHRVLLHLIQTIRRYEVAFKLISRSEKRKDGTSLPREGKSSYGSLETKIQGDCTTAIAWEDVYRTNKLRQFCLIDPRTKTKFPRKWRSFKTSSVWP